LRDLELPFSFKSSLDSFTRDLTLAAMRDELEPVCCREQEIERVITILIRQSKNNPVLLGDAGVGKTAVVEGLARRIVEGRVPKAVSPARIHSLSHIDLIAGTTFRGQYERRLQGIIQEASADPNVILFIDELHNLIGAGSALGAPMDAANMLKPALTSGQVRVIGATTEFEYQRYVVADGALERRFQPVKVGELDRQQTILVLKARRSRIELHHLMAIDDDALEAAADLSAGHLPDRKQPDRSIDLLDETCALIRMRSNHEPAPELRQLKQRVLQLRAAERSIIEEVLTASQGEQTPLEKLSRGTIRVFEQMGRGMERIITGQAPARESSPINHADAAAPGESQTGRLARLHCDRLLKEDDLKLELLKQGFVITAQHVRETAA